MSRVLTLPDEFKGAQVSWGLDHFLEIVNRSQTEKMRSEKAQKTFIEVLRQVEVFLSFMLADQPDYFRKAAHDFNTQSQEARIRVQDEQVKIQLLQKEDTAA